MKKLILLLPLLMLSSVRIFSQAPDAAELQSAPVIIPGPEPFSVDAVSAIYCINLLKNNRYLEKTEDSDRYKIVEVDTVWSWFLDYDESYPEGYRKRYDIIVNGAPLNWDNSYIEYGGRMINLRLLFLYRNQYPPGDLDYYLEN